MAAMSPLRCAATAVAAVVPWVAAGCAAGGERDITLAGVEPGRAHNDVPIALTIRGTSFRPAYRIDSFAGSAGVVPDAYGVRLVAVAGEGREPRARVSATAVTWQSAGVLVAQLPANIPAGDYDVEVVDPRNGAKTLERAFVSLGADRLAPAVAILEPADDSVLGAETTIVGILSTDDDVGHILSLSWTITGPEATLAEGSCPIPADVHRTSCTFSFATPRPVGATDPLVLTAIARDTADNATTATASLRLAPRPVVSSFAPRMGPAVGGTSLAIQGSGFVEGHPGTQILLDGFPIATTFASPGLLLGTTPAHDPGDGMLALRTGAAVTLAGRFSFFAAPIVRAVSPTEGPSTGGTPVAIVGNNFRGLTTILFDGEALVCPRVVSESRIEGLAPAGTGTVRVTAKDPIGGDGTTSVDFTYADDADGGLPPPGQCPGVDGGSPP
jgi:hypothetical protein